jgi:hypothetical protein
MAGVDNHMTSQELNEAELSDKPLLGNKETNETLQETSYERHFATWRVV